MKVLAHNSPSDRAIAGRGIVVSETNPVESSSVNDETSAGEMSRPASTRSDATNLSVSDPETIFPDAVIRGLIDDWVLPRLVDQFIESSLGMKCRSTEIQ